MTYARDFAIKAHGDQKYGDRPYVEHLDAVAAIVRGWGYGPASNAVRAAYLHDVLEDTPVTMRELVETFGQPLADMVWACTGVGDSREERNDTIYRRLRAVPFAIPVKVADRIANMNASEPGSRHARKYLLESQKFRARAVPVGRADIAGQYDAAVARLREG